PGRIPCLKRHAKKDRCERQQQNEDDPSPAKNGDQSWQPNQPKPPSEPDEEPGAPTAGVPHPKGELDEAANVRGVLLLDLLLGCRETPQPTPRTAVEASG